MPNFRYEIQDASGSVSSGVLQAPNAMEASSLLRSRGGYVLNVAPVGAGGGDWAERLRGFRIEGGPGLKDVYTFTNQLAVMVRAGINIRSAISNVAEQVEKARFRTILTQVKDDVESGQPLSDALGRHPKVFSPLYVNMVRASELAGSLGTMLERISTYLHQQMETRSMVRGAMIYPVIILVMAVTTTIFMLAFVLPRFTELFAGKEHLLPAPTKILMAMSLFVRTYWYGLVAGAGAAVVAWVYAIRTPAGRLYWDKFKLRMPLFRRMFRALYITRSLHTMGELVNAGVPMLETIDITAQVAGNSLYRRLWETVHTAVKEGRKITYPLERQTLLPRSVVQMISAGEESGKLGKVMRDVAEFYANELRNTIKAVTAMIEPIMIVAMGGVVGFIAASIILPIFKMSSLIE